MFLEFETRKDPQQELATGKQEAGGKEIAVAERPGALSTSMIHHIFLSNPINYSNEYCLPLDFFRD